MGRWRPKGIPASKYITAEGYKKLNDELQYLWKEKRPEITQSVQEAAAQGDRSENAEYIYGKKQLREIDRRVRFLSKRLDDMTVVDRVPEDQSKVFFGAWVELENEDGEPEIYRLVGPDEFDQSEEYTSMDSPLGKAVMGKALHEDILVAAPDRETRYTIVRIEYRPAKS